MTKKILMICMLAMVGCKFNYSCHGDEDKADVDSDLDVDHVDVHDTTPTDANVK